MWYIISHSLEDLLKETNVNGTSMLLDVTCVWNLVQCASDGAERGGMATDATGLNKKNSPDRQEGGE